MNKSSIVSALHYWSI